MIKMNFFRNENGQSMVEFALVLPILLFILLGIMEGGRMFGGYLELQHAARDGARYAAIHTDLSSSDIKTYVESKFVMLDSATLDTGSFQLNRLTTADKKDKWAEIKITYPLKIFTPMISAITGNPYNLNVSFSMRSE